mmetsp:Transcript_6790/g.10715  ORF Transcript_6790/g.10715 Transcript_6790/m.10715 type:complete len:230 (+) Transcript_6790:72-761(+)
MRLAYLDGYLLNNMPGEEAKLYLAKRLDNPTAFNLGIALPNSKPATNLMSKGLILGFLPPLNDPGGALMPDVSDALLVEQLRWSWIEPGPCERREWGHMGVKDKGSPERIFVDLSKVVLRMETELKSSNEVLKPWKPLLPPLTARPDPPPENNAPSLQAAMMSSFNASEPPPSLQSPSQPPPSFFAPHDFTPTSTSPPFASFDSARFSPQVPPRTYSSIRGLSPQLSTR